MLDLVCVFFYFKYRGILVAVLVVSELVRFSQVETLDSAEARSRSSAGWHVCVLGIPGKIDVEMMLAVLLFFSICSAVIFFKNYCSFLLRDT